MKYVLKVLVLIGSVTIAALVGASAQSWEQITPPLSMNYPQIACSADGMTLLLSGSRISIPIYLSTNSGGDWTITSAPLGTWDSFAISADGTQFVAANYDPRGIYTSTDRGTTWISNNVSPAGWTSVAASADGQRLIAVNNAPQTIYTSTNDGAVWAQATNAPLAIWRWVASSADGSKLIAVNYYPGTVYVSQDGGTTWIKSTNAPTTPWIRAASSADGAKLFALADAGQLYASADSGSSWILSGLPGGSWRACAASADASTLIVCSQSGLIYTSTDSGATWNSNAVPIRSWDSVALSADGRKLFAAADGADGGVWRMLTTPAPRLEAALLPGGLRLAWVLPSTNFVLQQSLDCTPASWEDTTNEPALNLTNLQYETVLPLSERCFYRLRSL